MEKILKQVDERIEEILNEGINVNNIDNLCKLTKIKHYTKEDEKMYNDYGRRYEPYGNYSAYDEYGRRGYDTKYRGHEHLDNVYNAYSRYEEGRRNYRGEDTKRSLEYMLRSMEDFARMLKEEAQNPEEVEMIRQTAQRIAQM